MLSRREPSALKVAPLKAVWVAQRLWGALRAACCSQVSTACKPAWGGKHSPPTQQLLISDTRVPGGIPVQAGRCTGWLSIKALNSSQWREKLPRCRIGSDSSMADTPWEVI